MSVRATLLEPEKTVATATATTFQRDPLDVVASNGREVEAFALDACAKRQESGLLVPKCDVPADLLDAAYERCNLVTGEYAKTFYLGENKPPPRLKHSSVLDFRTEASSLATCQLSSARIARPGAPSRPRQARRDEANGWRKKNEFFNILSSLC